MTQNIVIDVLWALLTLVGFAIVAALLIFPLNSVLTRTRVRFPLVRRFPLIISCLIVSVIALGLQLILRQGFSNLRRLDVLAQIAIWMWALAALVIRANRLKNRRAALRERFTRRGRAKEDSFTGDSLWADRELTDSSEDRFGFSEYVDVLTDRILNTETPSVLGIVGSWGSGKSSLMGLIDARLKLDQKASSGDKLAPRVRTIRINVWELGTQEEVWHAFLQAIFTGVYRNVRWWRKIDWRKLFDQAIRGSWRVLLVAAPAVAAVYLGKSGAGNWRDVISVFTFKSGDGWGKMAGAITQVIALFTLYRPAWEAIRKSIKFDVGAVLKAGSYEAQISELMKLRGRFARVVNLAVGPEGRIVIFIDDLDRCTPDKIPDVLEAIKLFASTEGCVYVLAFDQKIVAGRIAEKYGFSLDEGINYLEKIVQIPFNLPPLDPTDIAQFIREDYSDLRVDPAVFARGLSTNPRTVKRALNTYRIMQQMAEKRVAAWEIDPLDAELVAKMVVIQTRFKRLYAELIDSPELLLDLENWAVSENNADGPKTNIELSDFLDPREKIGFRQMLLAGKARFGSDQERDHVKWYIFLGGDAVNTEDELRPDRKYRKDLLSNVPDRIQKAFEQIFAHATPQVRGNLERTYRQRLRDILGDRKYPEEQRLSATLALDNLDGYHQDRLAPQTVRVPGREFLFGRNSDYVRRAKAAGIEGLSKDDGIAARKTCSPDFRIGRYVTTNREFHEFYLDLRRVGSFKQGIIEYEAYWQPCEPVTDGNPLPSHNSYQISCEHSAALSLKPETCTFRNPDDHTIAGRIELALKARAEAETNSEPPEYFFALEIVREHPSGREDRYSFELGLGPGFPVTNRNPESAVVVSSDRAKFGIETQDLAVRIRLMNADGKEIAEAIPLNQPFEVDLIMWDRTKIPDLTPSYTIRDHLWTFPEGEENHPVEVSWNDAAVFCMWLRDQNSLPFRLPTEVEWELAASGGTSPPPLFPWGDVWDSTKANFKARGRKTPVGAFPSGNSPFCCADMSGNVWEWCADIHSYAIEVLRDDAGAWLDIKYGKPEFDKPNRVCRGGDSFSDLKNLTCSSRASTPTAGIRVAVASGWKITKPNKVS